jgi:hypothetical protein
VTDSLEGRPSLNAGADGLEDLRLGEEMWRMELARESQSHRK